jgi:chaperonin GroES
MSVQPLGDRVVVRVSEAESVTASGLVIPETAADRPQRGTVVAVGAGRFEDGKRVPMLVAEGDEVVYSKYGGTEVTLDGEDLLILRESDILAKVG